MSRRSSTPTFDFSPDEMRRFCHPDEYPCYNCDNVYKPMSGCRERCCIPEGEGFAQVEGDSRCAQRGRAADGAPGGCVALGAAQLRVAQENLHSRHEPPPDLRGEERDRVQAVLRASKGWETAHPGASGRTHVCAVKDPSEI